MAYADLNTIHNPASGVAAPASWGDQVRDNFEFFNTMHPTGQGAWTIYTASVITQSVTVSRNLTYGRHFKDGRFVHYQAYFVPTSSGTANQPITVSLPFTAVQSALPCGHFYWFDASGAANYIAPAALYDTTHVAGLLNGSASYLGQTATVGGITYPNQIVATDALLIDVRFESTT